MTTTNATAKLFRLEMRQLWRTPAVFIWTLLLPLAAIIVMSVIPGARQPLDQFGGLSVVEAYQPTIIVFAITIFALQIMPLILGQYRENGFLRRLRTTPVHPGQLLFAVLAMVFIVVVAASLFMLGFPMLFGEGSLSALPSQIFVMLVTAASILAVGTMLAAVIPSAKVASGVGAVVAIVMWFFAGMWVPRALFPDWVAAIADWTPGGAAATLMSNASLGIELGWQPFLALVLWGVGSVLVALQTFRWE
ncbi:ABC transporter permease [Gulosibacter molinativorax]|uniref:ABC transporter permease n=1 Tax=Gulosibacter molinativorax TaxID=256821 RepID=A0ABT7C9R4_9MICO|nr:ABC transporter permease [Gulosibacter molinativorax]MDJ1371534.1 ABC transporter permease [Gulosibacter molinativorax]QUY62476.1 Transport permease protein [Gulosibacter molinativorax]